MDRKLRYEVYRKTNGRCSYCGKKLEFSELTLDHVVAKSKGGEDVYENLLPSCKHCNTLKKDYSLSRYRRFITRGYNHLLKSVPLFNSLLDYGIIKYHKQEEIVFYFETLGLFPSNPKVEATHLEFIAEYTEEEWYTIYPYIELEEDN